MPIIPRKADASEAEILVSKPPPKPFTTAEERVRASANLWGHTNPPLRVSLEKPDPVWIGIDPGASGGLAYIWGHRVEARHMSTTELDIWEWFVKLPKPFWAEQQCFGQVFAVVEKVQGFIGIAQPGSAAFKFGFNAGFLRGCLVASGIPFEEVPPQRWQKALGVTPRKKSESKTQWKNRLKQHAERLFPNIKITLATADALLMAEYARRTHSH